MVSEYRRRKEKPGMQRFYRASSLACPAVMQFYWNKIKCLLKKSLTPTAHMKSPKHPREKWRKQ